MPSKNRIKIYIEDGYYHLYNRGGNKNPIFLDRSDCIIFLRLLKQYLSPKEELTSFIVPGVRLDRLLRSNMHGEIELLAFALMPNHFHFLVRQVKKDGITQFMKKLSTSYAMYFNKKYNRVGHLFQERYKGVLVSEDNYLLHLTRYIHLNPRRLSIRDINFEDFTSYPYYLGLKRANWLDSSFVLEYFTEKKISEHRDSYKRFVEDYNNDFLTKEVLGDLMLDLEEHSNI